MSVIGYRSVTLPGVVVIGPRTLTTMRPYIRFVEWLGGNRLMLPVVSRIQTPVDRVLMKTTRGRVRVMSGAYPTLLLTATGRKTGKSRTIPLLFVERSTGGWVVADTNYGKDKRPGWCANLDANPVAKVSINGVAHGVTARTATAHECAAYWPKLDQVWPNFEKYRGRMRREPHIWILEPD